MGRFIIVDKDKKGNKCGERYTITYQIEAKGYERYKVDMFCICENPVRYCYIADQYGIGLETEKDRAEFLDEFYKFQKGGSYRKTHPIKYTKLETLNERLGKVKVELSAVEKEIREEEENQRELKFKTYYDDVDNKSLDMYVRGITKALTSDNRYEVSGIEFNIWEGHRIFIYDRELKKPVKIITIRDGKIDVRNLDKYDIKIK